MVPNVHHDFLQGVSLKSNEACPIGISDLVLLHNLVMQALSVAKPPNIWDLCPASLKTNFLKYLKLVCQAP